MRHALLCLAVLAACDTDRTPALPRPAPAVKPPPPPVVPAPLDAAVPEAPVVDAGPPGPAAREPVATLHRTACFGRCPAYTVSIYRDGVIEYDGTGYVKTKGKATGRLSRAKIDAIDRRFAAAHYFDFKDRYHADVTDAPWAITSWHHDGKVKTVEHYFGDDHAPEALTRLEDDLDKLIGIERWIGSEAERDKLKGSEL